MKSQSSTKILKFKPSASIMIHGNTVKQASLKKQEITKPSSKLQLITESRDTSIKHMQVKSKEATQQVYDYFALNKSQALHVFTKTALIYLSAKIQKIKVKKVAYLSKIENYSYLDCYCAALKISSFIVIGILIYDILSSQLSFLLPTRYSAFLFYKSKYCDNCHNICELFM